MALLYIFVRTQKSCQQTIMRGRYLKYAFEGGRDRFEELLGVETVFLESISQGAWGKSEKFGGTFLRMLTFQKGLSNEVDLDFFNEGFEIEAFLG